MHCDGHFYLLVSLLCNGVVFSFLVLISVELFWDCFTLASNGKVYYMVSSRRKEKMVAFFYTMMLALQNDVCYFCILLRLSYCAEHRNFMMTQPS